ncbi:MAG: hypothetical protein MRY83_18590, partial [Flavobacteriales bacterium]|nr:hypothetical protein [Flavobacteriales bacterium]
ENYLVIQQLRMPEKMRFKITIEESLDVEYIEIPSMLLQPIVENAIEHGVRKKASGEIRISVKKDEDITVSIEDSGDTDQNKFPKFRDSQKSHSIEIHDERVRLFNEKYHPQKIITQRDFGEKKSVVTLTLKNFV